jgi:hypothetical protein
MTSPTKSKKMLGLAVAVGAAAALAVLTIPEALAAPAQCSAGPATMCYKGSTYLNVPTFVQTAYLANGGSCGACQVSPM